MSALWATSETHLPVTIRQGGERGGDPAQVALAAIDFRAEAAQAAQREREQQHPPEKCPKK